METKQRGNPKWNIGGQTKGPHLTTIIRDVSRHFNIPVSRIASKDSSDAVVICRRIYCYVAYKLTNARLIDIGHILGRDHTSVINDRDKMALWIKTGHPKWIDFWFDYLEDTEIWGKNEKIR